MDGGVEGSIEATGSRMWTRTRNILIAGYSAIGVLIGVVGWLVLSGANLGISYEVYFFVFLPLLLASSFYTQWRYTRKVVGFVRAMAPRLRDVMFQRRAGVIAVFDNGILLRPLRAGGNGPAGFLFGTFLDRERNPVVPNKDQLVPWSKSFGRKQKTGSVSRKKGPESTRAQLEALRQALGSSAAFSVVEHHDAVSAAEPSYYVGIVMVDRKWLSKGTAVCQQVDAIDSFLKQMPLHDFSTPLSPH